MSRRTTWLFGYLALLGSLACAQLTINGGASGTLNFGTIGYGTSFFNLTPGGGSGSYIFDLSGPAIPGFRIGNAPDVPNNIAPSATAVLIGLPTTSGTFNSTIRLTDTMTSATVSRPVTFTVSDVDVYGLIPSGYGVGDTISFPFTGIGGSGTYTFALTGGTIPAGTSFDPLNAVLTGTLTAAQPFTGFTIQVTDTFTGKVFSRGFGMSVSPLRLLPASPATANPRVLPTATQNLQYSDQLMASGCTGGPCTFSIVPGDALPAGLKMTNTGLISGVPINVTYNSTFSVIISDPSSNSVTLRLGMYIIPQTPQALGFQSAGFLSIGDFPAGQDMRSNDIAAFGGVPPYTITAAPGSLPQGVFMKPGYSTFPGDNPDTYVFRSRVVVPGSYSVPITIEDSVGNSTSGTVAFRVTPIGFFYIFLPVGGGPTATLNVPYSEQLVPIGGTPPYTASLAGNAVAGMSINNSGFVSGTPLESGRFLPFSQFLFDSGGNSYFSGGNLTVNAPVGSVPLGINGGTSNIAEGSAPLVTIVASGSQVTNPSYTITLVSGSLPPGMTLLTGSDFNSGGNSVVAAQVAGVPSTPGTYSFILNVTDGAGGIGQRQYTLVIHDTLTFITSSMAPGQVGQAYSQTFDVRGGTPPYTFSLFNLATNNSTPPPGLSFDSSTGTISGTPTSAGATVLDITATDAAGSAQTIGVTFNIYSLEITTPNILPNVTSGRAYSEALSINPPGAYTWTATGLPFGLTIDLHTGVISGTVSNGATGASLVTVTAANASTAVVKNFTIFTTTLSSTWLLSGTGGLLGDVLVNNRVVTGLSLSGGTPPYNVTLDSGALPPGLDIVPDSVVFSGQDFGLFLIAGLPTTPGSYTFRVRYTDAAGLSIVRPVTLNVRTIALATSSVGPAALGQPFTAHLFGSGAPGPFAFALSPAFTPPNLGGLTLSSSGVLSGTPTQTGTFSFNVDITSGALTRRQGVSYTVEATGNRVINVTPGLFGVTDLPMGINFLAAISPSGGIGTQTWSIPSGSLPPGIQLLSGATLPRAFTPPVALLQGAPSVAGDYRFQVRVDDSTGNFGIREILVHVSPMRNGPINHPYSFTAVPPPMQVGTPYNYQITMLNSAPPVTFVDAASGVSTLMPTGVSMSSSGAISGAPSDGGVFDQTFVATDANGTTRESFTAFNAYPTGGTIGVVGSTSVNLSDATLGTAYSFNLNNLLNPGYGVGPFVWTLDSGAFPAGLGISGNFIVGTPTATGTSNFSVLVTDSQGTQHLVGPLSMNVSTMSITAGAGDTLAPAAQNSTYGALFRAAGATGPFTFRPAYFSDMPAGLSLASNGILSGTPIVQGPFQLWIDAVDGATGNVFRKRYVLTIGPPGAPPATIAAAPNNLTISYTVGNPAPAPVPINVTNAGGSSFTFTATASTASGGNWLTATLSPSPSSVPATVTATFNVAGVPPGTYNGAITLVSATASNSPFEIPVTLNVSAVSVCGFSLSAGSTTISAAGGPLGFDVNTGVGCDWTATTSDPWITIKTPSGTGSGTVSLNADPNPNPAQRMGTVTVQGLPFTVTEFGSSCAFSISPSSVDVTAGATSLPVTVNASGSGCAWTASGVSAFVSPVPPASGTGSGSVTVAIGANTGASRSGTATIAGQTFTVNQAGVGCTFSLSASNGSAAWNGGAVTPSVTMTAGVGCAWTTDSGPSWVHVGTGQSGAGNGSVTLSVDANAGVADRTANVLIGGQSFLITQPGAPCSFSIAANGLFQPAGGGSGSVNVTASAGCLWIASSNAGWITPSPASGTGNGSVSFTTAANSGAGARSAVLTVAGQNIVINQNGATCAYSLQSPSANLPSGGGPGNAGVVAAAGCPFTASSNVPWARITSGTPASGTGDVGYSVDQNTTGALRSGSLTIAGITFPVTQAAAACVVTLGTPGFSAGEFGGASSFTYTTSVSTCTPAIQSFSSWVTVTSTTKVGANGTVNFSVAANTFSAARSAVIRVGDVEFTVSQAPSSCAYTLTSFGATFPRLGGDGTVPMTFAPAACGPPPVGVASGSPADMISLGPVTSGPGTYTQDYSVSVYQTFINYVRTAQLLVQGQVYMVKQNSF